MSNSIIYNSQVLNNNTEPIQIDSNYILEKKLSKLKRAQEKELKSKLKIDNNDLEGEDASIGTDGSIEEDFMDEVSSSNIISTEELQKIEEEARKNADTIINDANQKAKEIIDKAREEAENASSMIYEKAKKEGYQAGIIEYQEELSNKEKEFDIKVKDIEDSFNRDRDTMEEDLLEVVLDVIEKVFYCQFKGKKDILINLCNRALLGVENSREILVRISKNNIEEFQNKLTDLTKDIPEEISIQAAVDPLLSDEECMIETDSGIIDCSLGTEMDNLIRDLKSLSK